MEAQGESNETISHRPKHGASEQAAPSKTIPIPEVGIYSNSASDSVYHRGKTDRANLVIPKTGQEAVNDSQQVSTSQMADHYTLPDGDGGSDLPLQLDDSINENGTPQATAGASILPGNRAAFPVASNAPGMGNDLADDGESGGRSEAEAVAPTSEQKQDCPLVSKSAKSRKKRALPKPSTSGQSDIKPLLPSLPTGFWWECPANDKGVVIKLRWRGGQAPHSHVFKRVGKEELLTWKEKKDEQWIISDRLRAELRAKGKRELARRIGLTTGDN